MSSRLLAWGELGHDIVVQVAVKKILDSGNSKLYEPFHKKSLMLGHLANVPDIVWKSSRISEQHRVLNSHTHYHALNKVFPKDDFQNIQRDIKKFEQAARKRNLDLYTEVGTAPWRIVQLFEKAKKHITNVSFLSAQNPKFNDEIDSALLYLGILSHYVGDLANPHHTAIDFDGWATKQGGIHAYFEEYCVSAQGLSLPNDVYLHSKSKALLQRVFSAFSKKHYAKSSKDPLAVAFALTYNSSKHISDILEIDAKHALVKHSHEDAGLKVPAIRKSPFAVADKFKPLIVDRLAIGATILAHLWGLAWEQSGRPDLSSFHSWNYPVSPNFIYPDYLP